MSQQLKEQGFKTEVNRSLEDQKKQFEEAKKARQRAKKAAEEKREEIELVPYHRVSGLLLCICVPHTAAADLQRLRHPGHGWE